MKFLSLIATAILATHALALTVPNPNNKARRDDGQISGVEANHLEERQIVKRVTVTVTSTKFAQSTTIYSTRSVTNVSPRTHYRLRFVVSSCSDYLKPRLSPKLKLKLEFSPE